MSAIPAFLGAIVLALAAGMGVFLLITVAGTVFKLIGRLFAHIGRFIGGEIRDAFRFVGAVLVAPVFLVLALGSIVVGRWSASAHYARAFRDEVKSAFLCCYRIAIGHPFRFIGLGSVMEGYEQRLPQVVAQAPTRDMPRGGKKGQFGGYNIVGSLPGGGSGGKLYIAEPDELKRAALARTGNDVDRVVIKTFSLHEGSSLPQILRESRALEAAKQLGLVLEHELADNDRFYYVMRYVPGESLAEVTRRSHASSPPDGLDDHGTRELVGYVADLARTLEHYHAGGLWHKDVKPDNIIVHDGRAELVDLGLITPLRSAMTLTTHGTEYFRDPELVRMALRGVKVHEVDGAKFDIYAAGAVLYSLIENSFPAHGGLSQVSKRCPDSVRWVIRRAMTDYDKRYANMGEMLADLRAILAAEDMYAMKPAVLPSRSRGASDVADEPVIAEKVVAEPVVAEPAVGAAPEVDRVVAAASPTPPRAAPDRSYDETLNDEPAGNERPLIRVVNWWTGRYQVQDRVASAPTSRPAAQRERATPAPAFVAEPRRPHIGAPGRTAREQVAAARQRAADRRASATRRIRSHRAPASRGFRPEIIVAALIGVGVFAYFLKDQDNRASAVGYEKVREFGHLVENAKDRTLFLASTLGEVSDDETRAAIESIVSEATGHGLEVRGLLDESYYGQLERSSEDFGRDTELLAELQLLVAGRPIEASDVSDDVIEWMKSRAEIDALAWMQWNGSERNLEDTLVVTFTDAGRKITSLAEVEHANLHELAQQLLQQNISDQIIEDARNAAREAVEHADEAIRETIAEERAAAEIRQGSIKTQSKSNAESEK